MVIITISGPAGSGKSTVCKKLAKKLVAEHIYVGGIRREIAREKGMTIMELNDYALSHSETDVDVDEKAAMQARELANSGKDVIVEGRTQFHFLPESIKIYVKVDSMTAAKRIWEDLKTKKGREERNEKKPQSVEELAKEIEARNENDAKRYMKYYKFDHRDESNYDFVLDTKKLNREEAFDKVLEFVESSVK